MGGTHTWTLNGAAIAPNAQTAVGQRLISQEPMAIVLNLAISSAFQDIDWADLVLPATMCVFHLERPSAFRPLNYCVRSQEY